MYKNRFIKFKTNIILNNTASSVLVKNRVERQYNISNTCLKVKLHINYLICYKLNL